MTRVKMNTKGFTLMEVLISIALVGLLFAPMLAFFSHSAKMNVNAKNMQRANTVAQSVMEEVRSYDTIADMVATYEDTVNTDLMRTKDDFQSTYSAPVVTSGGGFVNKEYYFVHKGLKNDGKDYTAKIKINTAAYDALNDLEVPIIASLGSGSTVMVAEKDETLNALYEYQSRYHSAPENNGNSISIDSLAEKLEKKIKVKITDDATLDGMVRVTIYNEYSIKENWHGCTESIQSEYLYNEEVVYEKLKGIYLFYNYDVFTRTQDTIFQGIDLDVEYLSHPDWTYDYTLYAICQKVYSVNEDISLVDDAMVTYADANKSTSKAVITKKIRKNGSWPGNYEGVINVFSNYNYKVRYDHSSGGAENYIDETSIDPDRKTMDSIVKKEKIQRLSEVTVQIYDSDNKLCVELKSTRGE